MLPIANLLVLSVACGQINGLSSRKVTQSLGKCSFARATIKYFGLIERPCSPSTLLYGGPMPDQLLFDQLRFIDRLIHAGVAEEQARAHAEALEIGRRQASFSQDW
jgi:hypothetical protein